MTKPQQYASALDASSYQAPGGGEIYAPLRKSLVEKAVAMGYDRATMVEVPINWSDDIDPFGHVKGHAHGHFVSACNVRVFLSFQEQLKDKFDDFMSARHISCVGSKLTYRFMRQVKFPDALLVANHLKEVLPDRYFGITTVWSLNQQAIVAETRGWAVFFDHDKGKPANLIEAGGVYAELHKALVERKEREEKLALKWEADHPKKQKAKI